MSANKIFFASNCLWFFVFLSLPIVLSAQVSTSLNQSFRAESAQSIVLQINSSNLEIKYIQGSRILVETKVSLSAGNSSLLDFVAKEGRYNLVKEMNVNTKCLTLVPKKTQNLILIKGKELQEHISYIIYIPKELAFIDLAQK
jgi:cell division protein YceG involved in septum cleavage